MKYIVRYSTVAMEQLDTLPLKISEKIVNKIEVFRVSPSPIDFAKSLTGNFKHLYRFRIGDYRAIFEILPNGEIHILNILSIKHRKDVYRL